MEAESPRSAVQTASARRCRGCGYPRAGLAPGAPCPECGAAPPPEPADGCLGCGYPRAGLAPGAPCPECGEAPPKGGWIVLRGWSNPGNPWIGMVVSAVALLFAAVVVVAALRRGTLVQLFPCVGVPLVATAAMLAAMKRARAATVGGDVVWIVKEQELEIRNGAQRRAFALRSFVKCRHTGSILGTWHRLLLSRGFWSISAGPSIWLRRRDVDAPALKVEIERRLERRPWWRWR